MVSADLWRNDKANCTTRRASLPACQRTVEFNGIVNMYRIGSQWVARPPKRLRKRCEMVIGESKPPRGQSSGGGGRPQLAYALAMGGTDRTIRSTVGKEHLQNNGSETTGGYGLGRGTENSPPPSPIADAPGSPCKPIFALACVHTPARMLKSSRRCSP